MKRTLTNLIMASAVSLLLVAGVNAETRGAEPATFAGQSVVVADGSYAIAPVAVRRYGAYYPPPVYRYPAVPRYAYRPYVGPYYYPSYVAPYPYYGGYYAPYGGVYRGPAYRGYYIW